jgi:hypothetical protein
LQRCPVVRTLLEKLFITPLSYVKDPEERIEKFISTEKKKE